MDKIIHIDFETRSTTPIDAGLCNYAKTAEVLCLAYEDQLWTPEMDPPVELLEHVENGGLVAAHNAMFEYFIWNYCTDWPKLKLEQLRDTMAQCAMCNIPQSLEKAAETLRLAEQKDKRGHYLIRHLCVPRKPTKTNPSIWFEEPELYQELYRYCLQDVKVEKRIYETLPKLSEYEQKVWELTQKINLAGVPIDMSLVDLVNDLMNEHKQNLEQRSIELLGFSVTQAAKLTQYLGSENVQAATVDKLLETAEGDKKEALQLRKALSTTSTAKFKKLPSIVCDDSTVKNLFVYHGAGPGRFASRGGLNVQNFSRPSYKQETALRVVQTGDLEFMNLLGEPMDFFSSVTRAAIHGDFIDADFSSVENRVASWIVEDGKTLKLFRKGLDQYKALATKMYHVEYDQVTKDQRQVAKYGVLGGIYGQGAKGFIKFAEGYGVYITAEESESIISAYRADYPQIVKMWYRMGDCSIRAVQTKKPVIVNKYLAFNVVGDFLVMRLPSRRKLYFYQPRVEKKDTPWGEKKPVVTAMGLNTYSRKFERIKLIGSSLFQSAVQGTARDLLVNGMMNLDAVGVIIRMHVHDETLADNTIEEAEFNRLMCALPDWANGLPLESDSWTGDRYKK